MVTTRGQSSDALPDEDEINDENTINVYVPSSPRKRKRSTKSSKSAEVADQTNTTPIAKKTKVATSDDERQSSTSRLVVEIPAKDKASFEDIQKLEMPEDGSQKSAASNKLMADKAEDGSLKNTRSKKPRNEIAQLDGRWDEEDDYTDDEDHVYMKSPAQIKQELSSPDAGKRRAVYAPVINRRPSPREVDMNQSYVSNSDDEEFNKSQAKDSSSATETKHKRFGSNEQEEQVFSTAREQVHTEQVASDDDAPEEMATQDAVKQVRDKGKGIAMAASDQKTANPKKTKVTQPLSKNQEEPGKRKRGWAEGVERSDKSEHYTPRRRMINYISGSRLGLDGADDEKYGQEEIEETGLQNFDGQDNFRLDDTTPLTKSTINIAKLPNMLPAEFLEEDDVHPIAATEYEVKKAKKIKFADVEKKPKDRRNGSTTYRVSEALDKHLAPKSSIQAKATKEAWLHGRVGKGAGFGSNRRPFSAGFFK